MRNLNEYAARCMKMLDEIGIEYGNIQLFKINSRAKSRWGRCSYTPSGGYTIEVNSSLLEESNSEEGLMNTIIHELLHSCKGCMNHGVSWKRLAEKVYQAYGINIKRTSTAEEKGVTNSQPARKPKYQVVCQSCGKTYDYHRSCNAVKHPENYRCVCKGSVISITL